MSALIRVGALINDIKGKIGGQYFSAKKGSLSLSQCAKTAAPPDKPRVRGPGAHLADPHKRLAQTAKGWPALNDDHRNAWIAYAGTLTFYNKMNLPYTPSGYEVYCQRNMQLAQVSEPPLVLPSLGVSEANIDLVVFGFTGTGTIGYNYDDSAVPANTSILLSASNAGSNGAGWPRGGYKQIYASTVLSLTVVDLTAAYVGVFGAVPELGTVFFKTQLFATDSGIVNGSKLTKADAGLV